MSDSEDPPPPLPASPPPPPMEDSDLTPPPPKRRTSEKILVLQKILRDNGGLGMYNSPGDAGGAPPPSATASLDATDSSWEPPKLSHITKSRPKRKVRPPSRNSSLVRDDSVAMETTGHISAVEEEESGPTFNEELDPPLPPMSAPPGPPPELPEEDTQLQGKRGKLKYQLFIASSNFLTFKFSANKPYTMITAYIFVHTKYHL